MSNSHIELLKITGHDCWEHSQVIKCDGKEDECKCRVCGKEFTTPCNFDEDCS
jgi:hypothetical protein